MRRKKGPKVTSNVAAILAVMLADASRGWYGLELAKEAEVGSATVYAALARLEGAGWVKGSWETIDPRVSGRPRRRLYLLTGEGARCGGEALARQHAWLGRLFEKGLREETT